jgi:hypothetical protein
MPKKPPRDNRKARELRTVHTAGAGAAALLQRITRRAQVVVSPASEGEGGVTPWLVRLRGRLPEEQRAHLLDVLEKEAALVLFVDSAAWAARIRLSLPELSVAAGRPVELRLFARRGNKKQTSAPFVSLKDQ